MRGSAAGRIAYIHYLSGYLSAGPDTPKRETGGGASFLREKMDRRVGDAGDM